jgi:hypothetical protein
LARQPFLLATAILNDLASAQEAENACIKLEQQNRHIMPDDAHYIDDAQQRSTLRYYVEGLFQKSAILAELLSLPAERARIEQIRSSMPNDELNTLEIDPLDDFDGYYCPALGKARRIFDNLAIIVFEEHLPGIEIVQTILENTAKILADHNIIPKKEKDIKDAVFQTLKYAFRDSVREVPIAQTMKTYKPDIGIRALKVAIEYKFARSEEELKAALDGIYADMKGYGGHHEWQTFYAVIYTTGPFCTQRDLEHEFTRIKAEGSWKPLLIQG